MIKDYIDLANTALKGYRRQFIDNLISPPKKRTIGWWNEILVYDVKIIDMFVLNRVIGDPKKNIMNHTRAEIEKLASQAKGSNPITIGTPAQYRKWFTKRKGKIVK